MGRLSLDDIGNRLVYTYFKGLNRVEPKTYLELEPPPAMNESGSLP